MTILLYFLAAIGALWVLYILVGGVMVAIRHVCKAKARSRALDEEYRRMTGDGR